MDYHTTNYQNFQININLITIRREKIKAHIALFFYIANTLCMSKPFQIIYHTYFSMYELYFLDTENALCNIKKHLKI